MQFCSVPSHCRWATAVGRKKGTSGLLISSSRLNTNQSTFISFYLTLKGTPATRNNGAHLKAVQNENGWAGKGCPRATCGNVHSEVFRPPNPFTCSKAWGPRECWHWAHQNRCHSASIELKVLVGTGSDSPEQMCIITHCGKCHWNSILFLVNEHHLSTHTPVRSAPELNHRHPQRFAVAVGNRKHKTDNTHVYPSFCKH